MHPGAFTAARGEKTHGTFGLAHGAARNITGCRAHTGTCVLMLECAGLCLYAFARLKLKRRSKLRSVSPSRTRSQHTSSEGSDVFLGRVTLDQPSCPRAQRRESGEQHVFSHSPKLQGDLARGGCRRNNCCPPKEKKKRKENGKTHCLCVRFLSSKTGLFLSDAHEIQTYFRLESADLIARTPATKKAK